MAKRRSTKPGSKKSSTEAAVRQALSKLTKAALVDLLMELAKGDQAILQPFTKRFKVTVGPNELVPGMKPDQIGAPA